MKQLFALFAALAMMAAPAMAMEIDLTDEPTFVLADTGADPGLPDMLSIDTIVMFSLSSIDTAITPAVMLPTYAGTDIDSSTWTPLSFAMMPTAAVPTPPEVGGSTSLAWPSTMM